MRQLRGRWYTLCVSGSLLLHAGVAAWFLARPAPSIRVDGFDDVQMQPAVEVSLVRNLPQPDAPAENLEPETKPQPERPARPRPQAPGDARIAAIQVRPADTGPQGAAPNAADDLAKAAASQSQPRLQSNPTIGLDYQRRLLEYIQPYRQYPEAATRAGVRGVVDLVFELDRGGRVLKVWVVRSSGSDILDTAAVATLQRAAPLPPIPPELPNQVTVRLPVAFTGNG